LLRKYQIRFYEERLAGKNENKKNGRGSCRNIKADIIRKRCKIPTSELT
jgi:hypothetical protein